MNTKPRIEYEATDIIVDALTDEAAAIHIHTTDPSVDVSVLLTTDQLRQLSSQIDDLLAHEAAPSGPQ